MRKIFFTLITLCLCINILNTKAEPYQSNTPEYGYDTNIDYSKSNLQGYALFVPSGLVCDTILSQNISSQSAIAGQTVDVILKDDFKYMGKTIAPAGSIINGNIVSNKKAREKSPAKTMIKFTTIRTPYNNIIPINAIIKTDDMSGVLQGNKTEKTIKYALYDANKTKKLQSVQIQANSIIPIVFIQAITLTAQ